MGGELLSNKLSLLERSEKKWANFLRLFSSDEWERRTGKPVDESCRGLR